MTHTSGSRGFVCSFSSDIRDGAADTIVQATTDGGAFTESGVSLTVRTWPTTPEADDEWQPVVTPHVAAAYIGRIDNREDLAAQLGRPELLRRGDGDLFVAAYERWGDPFAANVIGEYSVVLVDRRARRLLAGRDSLGLGRLYVYEAAGTFWVASSLDMLLWGLPERPPLDRESIAEYFAQGGLMTSGRTIYAGIREVPPAHVVSKSRGSATVSRYWEPDRGRLLRLRDSREVDEAFRAELFAGVRASLRSNSPVWCDLSGGLDSSTVTAVAALCSDAGSMRRGLGAFSMFSSQTADDETAYQREMLDKYPMAHFTLDADAYLSFSTLDEPPSAHPSKAMLYRPLWSAVARLFEAHGVVTHLTGRGGDPLFCGDNFAPLYLSDFLRRMQIPRWFRETVGWARQGERSLLNLVYHCSLGLRRDNYAGALKGAPPPWLQAEFRDAVRRSENDAWLSPDRHYSSAARELQYRSTTQTAAIPRFIPIGDERHPLLYRPLVELALSLDWKHLLGPTQDRVVQRRALAGILPEGVRLRTSKASGTALLLRGLRENWPNARWLADGKLLSELGLVNPTAFREAAERFRHGLMGRELRYFVAAFSLELWLAANPSTPPAPAL